MAQTNAIELIQLANKIGLKDELYVVLKNQLNLLPKKAKNIILNLSSDAHKGTHWTALRIEDGIFIYFDSFGVMPPEEVIKMAKKYKSKIYYNINQYQHINEGYCGEFSLLFLFSQENSLPLESMLKVIKSNPF